MFDYQQWIVVVKAKSVNENQTRPSTGMCDEIISNNE